MDAKAPELTGLALRSLQLSDYHRGFLELLGQLTDVGDVSFEQFQRRFADLLQGGEDNHTVVIEEQSSGKIIATGTLMIMKKYIHTCSQAGFVEDVVVGKDQRGRQLGKAVVDDLVRRAHTLGCYKVILNCSPVNAPFYSKCGFEENCICMAKYFTTDHAA